MITRKITVRKVVIDQDNVYINGDAEFNDARFTVDQLQRFGIIPVMIGEGSKLEIKSIHRPVGARLITNITLFAPPYRQIDRRLTLTTA